MPYHPTPQRLAFYGFFILVFSMGVGRFAFTPLLPVMQADGLLTIGASGLLASAHFVGYAMGAAFASFVKASSRTSLLASLIVIGVSTLAMGVSNALWVWLAARWLAGVASAVALVVVSTHIVKRLAAAHRGDLQGVVFSGVGVGTALVGFVMLAAMASDVPSHGGWIGFGLATLAATVFVAAVFTDDARQPPQATVQQRTAGGGGGAAWRIMLAYGAMGAGYIIPATYLPVMAQQSVASPLVFGWGWPIFGLAAALSTLVAGRLSARFSDRAIWMTSQIVMAVGLALPALVPGLAAVILGGICVGGTFMVITMAGMKEAHRLAPAGSEQFFVSLMTTSFAVGQIIGPLLAGWAYDLTGSFVAPLMVGALILVTTLAPMSTAHGALFRRQAD